MAVVFLFRKMMDFKIMNLTVGCLVHYYQTSVLHLNLIKVVVMWLICVYSEPNDDDDDLESCVTGDFISAAGSPPRRLSRSCSPTSKFKTYFGKLLLRKEKLQSNVRI